MKIAVMKKIGRMFFVVISVGQQIFIVVISVEKLKTFSQEVIK